MNDEYSRLDFERTFAKIVDHPASLTGRDVLILREYGADDLATRAAEAKWKATERSTPPKSKSLSLTVDAIADVVVATVKRIEDARTLTDAAKDARVAALESRVLELEARQATIEPDHVRR